MPATASNQPFELLMDYLQGKINAHQLRSAFTDNGQMQHAFAAYQDAEFTPEQKKELQDELAVPEDAAATISDASNLLDLIDNLNKAGYGYGHLADFRYQLKKIKPEADWTGTLYSTTLLTGIISSFFLLNHHQRDLLEALLIHVAPFIPPFLLVGYQFYTIYRQARTTLDEDTYHSYQHRIQRWLVSTLPSLLNLSAYVAIAVVGSMSPISAALFIASSLVAVADGALRFYHRPSAEEQAEPNTASAIRQENRKNRTGQTLDVKIYAAVALSVTVVVSCIFPPSIFVVLSYSALFILIPWTKNSFLNKIHTESSAQLQTELRAFNGHDTAPASQVEQQLQTRIQELEAELKHHKDARVTEVVTSEEALASQTGIFQCRPKPTMKSITTQTDEYESGLDLTASL
ncbi:MAG: hypothetical protein P1U36_03780 [Legionellaceae bacterium]|nr:hypothetical protein [Legionellaceae bacterium]